MEYIHSYTKLLQVYYMYLIDCFFDYIIQLQRTKSRRLMNPIITAKSMEINVYIYRNKCLHFSYIWTLNLYDALMLESDDFMTNITAPELLLESRCIFQIQTH